MSPPNNDRGRPGEEAAPGVGLDASSVVDPADVPAQIRRRRGAALRLPPMPCGQRDPLDPDTRFRCVECKRDVRLRPYVRLTSQSVLCKPCFKASGGAR
jgi:hypothetical protein